MKRFAKEYINYKRKNILENELMQERLKAEKLENIERVERYLNRGMITIDEGMKILAEA